MTFATVGSTSDLAPGTMKGVEVDGQKLLLANVDGTFYAIQRKCPHMASTSARARSTMGR